LRRAERASFGEVFGGRKVPLQAIEAFAAEGVEKWIHGSSLPRSQPRSPRPAARWPVGPGHWNVETADAGRRSRGLAASYGRTIFRERPGAESPLMSGTPRRSLRHSSTTMLDTGRQAGKHVDPRAARFQRQGAWHDCGRINEAWTAGQTTAALRSVNPLGV